MMMCRARCLIRDSFPTSQPKQENQNSDSFMFRSYTIKPPDDLPHAVPGVKLAAISPLPWP